LSGLVLSCLLVSSVVLICLVALSSFRLVSVLSLHLPFRVVSCLVVSCLILSYLVLSCPLFVLVYESVCSCCSILSDHCWSVSFLPMYTVHTTIIASGYVPLSPFFVLLLVLHLVLFCGCSIGAFYLGGDWIFTNEYSLGLPLTLTLTLTVKLVFVPCTRLDMSSLASFTSASSQNGTRQISKYGDRVSESVCLSVSLSDEVGVWDNARFMVGDSVRDSVRG
jgi:hypothetical protein